MGEITKIIEKHSGGTCYQTERFTLDHFIPPEYQDKDEVFDSDKRFETANKTKKNISLRLNDSVCSLFSYFLDGSRRVYKIFDFGSTDGKFLPIVAGQIEAAVCCRHSKKLKPVGWTDEGSPTEIKIGCWSSQAHSNLHEL